MIDRIQVSRPHSGGTDIIEIFPNAGARGSAFARGHYFDSIETATCWAEAMLGQPPCPVTRPYPYHLGRGYQRNCGPVNLSY